MIFMSSLVSVKCRVLCGQIKEALKLIFYSQKQKKKKKNKELYLPET